MNYIKPEIEKIELVNTNMFICCSDAGGDVDPPWDDPETPTDHIDPEKEPIIWDDEDGDAFTGIFGMFGDKDEEGTSLVDDPIVESNHIDSQPIDIVPTDITPTEPSVEIQPTEPIEPVDIPTNPGIGEGMQ